ncbi:MAG: hypothetical protein KJ622_07945 [Alphaproteobacteria bacterium]|nr:hypothetical protein [Alphaproteobacteria bacterium]
MTDVKKTSADADGQSVGHQAIETPEIDGSVDALVANLRAAKEQLADLLAGADRTSATAGDNAPKSDRSAA